MSADLRHVGRIIDLYFVSFWMDWRYYFLYLLDGMISDSLRYDGMDVLALLVANSHTL